MKGMDDYSKRKPAPKAFWPVGESFAQAVTFQMPTQAPEPVPPARPVMGFRLLGKTSAKTHEAILAENPMPPEQVR
jgi:hypothetical protein